MARGLREHQARLQALSLLGKTLARRAGSSCELCETGGVPLRPWEVPPAPEDPDLDRTLLLCERCRKGADGGPLEGAEWRFLDSVVWSDQTAVQVTATRALRRLAERGVAWAVGTVENLYLSPESEEWLAGD